MCLVSFETLRNCVRAFRFCCYAFLFHVWGNGCSERGSDWSLVTASSGWLNSNVKSCLSDFRACALNHLESLCFLKENGIGAWVCILLLLPSHIFFFSSSLFIFIITIIQKHCRCPGLYLTILTLFLVLKWRILLLVLNAFDMCWQLEPFPCWVGC